MKNDHQYTMQISAVSTEAARIMSAPLNLLVELLDSPRAATRGASVCLLRDFARGIFPPLSLRIRMNIVRKLEGRLTVETDPFLRELIVRELAHLMAQDDEPPFGNLEPSEN